MKALLIFLRILGVALVMLFGADLLRILGNTADRTMFDWLPGDTSFHIGVDVVMIILGGMLSSWAIKRAKNSR